MWNEIQAARYNEGIQKLMWMSQEAPAPQMGSDISPVLDIGDPPPENRYLMSERLCVGQAEGAANAGQSSWTGILNPAGSGLLIVVEKIVVNKSVTGRIFFFRARGLTGTVSTTRCYRDTRINSDVLVVPGGIVQSGIALATAPGRNNIAQAYVLATTTFTLDIPWVLGPLSSIGVFCETLNEATQATYFWRERALLASEL
jgi:hypothetical protein